MNWRQICLCSGRWEHRSRRERTLSDPVDAPFGRRLKIQATRNTLLLKEQHRLFICRSATAIVCQPSLQRRSPAPAGLGQ